MYYAFLMSCVQCRAGLAHYYDCFGALQPFLPFDLSSEVAPFQELHDQVGGTLFLGNAEICYRNGIWMAYLGCRPSLATEPLDGDLIRGEVRVQDFDRYRVLHLNVGGAVNRPHSAFSHSRVEAVFVVEQSVDQGISLFSVGEGLTIKWADGQFIFQFPLARWAYLHSSRSTGGETHVPLTN